MDRSERRIPPLSKRREAQPPVLQNATAMLPAGTRRSAVLALSEAGLIDLGTGSRFRVHGLDAERAKRAAAATRQRTGRDPDGTQLGPRRDPEPPYTPGRSRGRDEDRRDEGNGRAPNDPFDDAEGEALAWLSRHGCDVRPGNGYHQKLVVAVQQHGSNAVIGMFDRLATAGTQQGDIKGFLFGAIDALNARTRPSLQAVEAEDQAAKSRAKWLRELEATQIRIHDNGAHFDAPSPVCPRCKKVTA